MDPEMRKIYFYLHWNNIFIQKFKLKIQERFSIFWVKWIKKLKDIFIEIIWIWLKALYKR